MSELKRTLGLFECTVMGVGVILGAGIYALIGEVAALGGNAVWMSFIGAAVVATFTGLSYAELSSMMPAAGGEYSYARRAFGPMPAFVVTWLLLAGLAIASAAVALGFGGYLQALVPLPKQSAAIALVLGSSALLFVGVKQAAWFAMFCTFLEVVGLLAVLWVGLPLVGQVDLLELDHGWIGLGSAAALIFFAYIGFEEIVQLAEETRDPTRSVPRALLLCIAITTLMYVLVAVAAISVLGWEVLGASESPLADVLEHAAGQDAGAAIALLALFSTANTVLVLLLSASRIVFGMARDDALPDFLAHVSERQIPWTATLLVAACAIVVIVTVGDVGKIAQLTNAAIFTTFFAMNVAVIVLRVREPWAERPFRIPGAIGPVPLSPLFGLLSVVLLGLHVEGSTWFFCALVCALGVALHLGRTRRRAGPT
jgi:APA family basic amino acid/polyamine antiporter